MKIPEKHSPKNYPSGKYLGDCRSCGESYLGEKRSRLCFECHSKSKGEWDEITQKP